MNAPEINRELTKRDGKEFAPFTATFKVSRDIAKTETEGWFSVSSETPCMEICYLNGQWQRAYVILSHSPDAVNMDWIKDGIKLRDRHGGDQIAKLTGPMLRAGKLGGTKISWSVSERAQELRADYENGVRDECSVEGDYSPDSLTVIGEREGVPLVRCSRWTPLAAALAVVTPADPNVGLNRSADGRTAGMPDATKTEPETKPAAAPAKAPAPAIRSKIMEKTPEQIAREKQGHEAAEIHALCAHFDVPMERTAEFLKNGATLDDVRAAVLRDFASKKSATAPAKMVEAKQTEIVSREIKKGDRTFSLMRAAMGAVARMKGEKPAVDDGFERECSQETARVLGRDPRGSFFVPWDAPVNRTIFQISGAGTGSDVVAQNLRPDLFINAFYAKLVLAKLGVKFIPGLVGDILLPKMLTSVSTGWVDETTATSATYPVMGQVKGTPHTAGAYVDITRQLQLQATPAADSIVTNALMSQLARTVQTGAFHGTGANNQPTGLFTALNAGYQGQAAVVASTITNPGTGSEIAKMLAVPEESNVDDDGSFKFVMRPLAHAALMGVSRIASIGSTPVADFVGKDRIVMGHPCETTASLTAGYGAVGRWDLMDLATWGATDILVDPFSLSTSGGLRIVALQNVDVMHEHLPGFAWATTFATS